MEKKLQLQIKGMSCMNCRDTIEDKLNNTCGIISADVCYDRNSASITYDSLIISDKAIITIIEQLGYNASESRQTQWSDFVRKTCTLAIIVTLYAILTATDLLNLLVPGQLADPGMSCGMLFIIGLLTSVHCVAMCGGINLSQCITLQHSVKSDFSVKHRLINNMLACNASALLYNSGRIISYTAIGFVLGIAGMLAGSAAGVEINVFLQGALKIVAGIIMIIMGVNMLGLFSYLRRLTINLRGLFHIGPYRSKAASRHPFCAGLLNGLMPCGPLQSMWIVAFASGSPVSGAFSMLMFSLGTVPLMIFLGSAASVLSRKFTHTVVTAGAVLIVVLGLAMLSQGGSLSGLISPEFLLLLASLLSFMCIFCSIPLKSKVAPAVMRVSSIVLVVCFLALWYYQTTDVIPSFEETDNSSYVEMVDGIQVVHSTLEAGSYPDINVQAGIPVKWIIDAPDGSINGCNNRMLIRELDIEYDFHPGENIIEFNIEDPGTIKYSCWMGMIRGNISVTKKKCAFSYTRFGEEKICA